MIKYLKFDPLAMAQVTWNLDRNKHGILLRLMSSLRMGQNNIVTVPRKNIFDLNFGKNQDLIGAFRKELLNVGFWYALGSDKFMINPETLNNTDLHSSKLMQKIYLAKGGLPIEYPQNSPYHEVREARNTQKLLEIELDTAIKSAAKAIVQEKNPKKKVKEDARKMDLMQKEIDNLKKSMELTTKRLNQVAIQAESCWHLLGESTKRRHPQLKLVKN